MTVLERFLFSFFFSFFFTVSSPEGFSAVMELDTSDVLMLGVLCTCVCLCLFWGVVSLWTEAELLKAQVLCLCVKFV